MKIDLYEKKKIVYKLLNNARVPQDAMDEMFQEFALYFYTNYNYDSDYKESSYIYLTFSNFLAANAIKYKTKDSLMRQASRIDEKREDWLDWMQSERDDSVESSQEISLYCEELMSKFKPVKQEYILERAGGRSFDNEVMEEGVIRRISREDGVSRQAVEGRIDRDVKKVLKSLKEQGK